MTGHSLDTHTVYSRIMLSVIINQSSSSSSSALNCPKSSEESFSWDNVETPPIAYSLNRILGEGVSSIVYEATHPFHGVCAVKVMRDDYNEYAEEEIALLRKVQGHPNMIKVLDTWETDGVWHIAMEKLEGSLNDISDALDNQAVYDFALQLTSSVMYLHHIGIVHFDLKPCNIGYTFGPNGVVYKILDLGLSELTSLVKTQEFKDALKSGDVKKVSLWYRPIESFVQPEAMNEKADVWSIGCILYELLNDDPLFECLEEYRPLEYNLKVYEEGIKSVFPLLLNTNEKVRLLAQLILDCLETNPDTRVSAGLAWWNLVMN
jgi:serine/threonine protein kinase